MLYIITRTNSSLQITAFGPWRTEHAADLAKRRIEKEDPMGDYSWLVLRVHEPLQAMKRPKDREY